MFQNTETFENEKVKTRRVLLDDVVKNHLKDREDNTRIFQESKTEKIEVDIFYGDASIKVTIYRHFSYDKVWTDSKSSVDEEETYDKLQRGMGQD